jgi:Domain of Unknown Function with PDB structure (DUF3857)
MRLSKPLSFCILLLFIATVLYGQKPPIKWGKIPDEDLAMTVYEPDPEAAAVVLCNYASLTFEYAEGKGLVYRFSHHKRIKILKSSASEEGNISIDYYGHQKAEKIVDLKAQVILPDGSEQSIGNKDIFNDKVNDYWEQKRFAIPNVQEGAVIEYKYDLISEHISTLRDWYFQEEIPTRHSELRVSIPEFLNYVYLFQSKENIAQSNIDDGGVVDPDFGDSQIHNMSYIMRDMPGMTEESFVTTMDDYRARLKFQLREYRLNNGLMKPFFSSWEDVVKRLKEEADFGEQYLKKGQHKKVLEAAEPYLAKAETAKDKIKAAQEFIVSNVAWSGNYGIYTTKGQSLNQLFEKKEANSGGLNLMLLAILKNEGIKAWPLLCSTRGNGKMFPLYPILDQFIHTMVYVELEGETMVLDVHDAFHPAGLPHVNALNKAGWIMDEENPQWIEIKPKGSVEKYLATMTLQNNGTLSGKIDGSMEGYVAIRNRQKLQTTNKKEVWTKTVSDRYPEAIVDSVSLENEKDIYQPLLVKIDGALPQAAQVNGEFIYLSPIVIGAVDENIFKEEKRDYPVDIPYPFSDVYVLNLQLPEGYAIESLPEGTNMSLPGDGGKFKFMVNAVAEDRIQIVSNLSIKQLYYEPEEYKALKYFFDLVVAKQQEQIVLKKKKT